MPPELSPGRKIIAIAVMRMSAVILLTTPRNLHICLQQAGVVKLVDAEDSKSSARKGMSVRFRPPAPFKNQWVIHYIG